MNLLLDVIHDFMARSFYILLKSKYRSYKVFPVLNYAIQHKRDVRSVETPMFKNRPNFLNSAPTSTEHSHKLFVGF